MGAWGTKIFQSDVALDVKEEYKGELLRGNSDEAALQAVKESCLDFVSDMDDQYDFWFALASYSFDLGRLLPEVKEKAVSLIDEGGDLDRWEGQEKAKRSAVLNELKAKLLSEQPPRKEFKPLKKRVSPLEPNDVYYFQLSDDQLKRKYYYNYYVIVLVDGAACEDFRVRGFLDEYPLVYLKVCKSLPDKIETLDEIPMSSIYYSYDKPYLNEDHRVLMLDGFRTFKKRLMYLGSYDFKREDTIGRRYDSTYKKYVPVLHDDNTWRGYIRDWTFLVRDLTYAMDVVPDLFPHD